MFGRYLGGVRSSRLMAVLLALQRDRKTTAAELARELEVSVRTIHRDVAALQMAGVPIYTEQGSGGGISIVDRWRSPIEHLSSEEVSALSLGSGAAADLGLGAVLALARSKLRSGLPRDIQVHLDHVSERVMLDTRGWFQPPHPDETLKAVSHAVWNAKRLDLRYRRADRTVSRRVDPLGLVLKAGVWYLVAAHRGQPRTYRASRIVAVTLRSEDAHRPPAFDLERYWVESGDAFDSALRRIAVRLTVPAASLAELSRHVPGRLTQLAVDSATDAGDGRFEVELGMESVEVATDQLAAIAGVEVLDPPGLRESLRRLGEDLATRNRGEAGP